MTNDEEKALVEKAKGIVEVEVNYYSEHLFAYPNRRTLRAELNSWLAHKAYFERHEARPFNWMTDRAVGMFDEFHPEPPQLPRCVTCWHRDFPCPEAVTTADLIVNGVKE